MKKQQEINNLKDLLIKEMIEELEKHIDAIMSIKNGITEEQGKHIDSILNTNNKLFRIAWALNPEKMGRLIKMLVEAIKE